MQTVQAEFSDSYNSLLSVARANQRLKQLGGDETVSKVLTVIYEAGLQETVGLRLLHKHNDILPHEVMFESSLVDEEGYALVTAATSIERIDQLAPNSWRSIKNGYVPSEFSHPSLLVSATFDPKHHERSFQRLTEALNDFGAADVLGPCINYSGAVKSYSPGDDAAFLEKTDTDNRANVVRYVRESDPSFTNSAKTKWYAKPKVAEDGKLTWTVACNCFCSVAPEGGHLGTKTHR